MLIPDPSKPGPSAPRRRPERPTPEQIRRRRITGIACIVASVVLLVVALVALFSGGGSVTGKPAAAAKVPVTIQWVGDITPGSSAGVPPGDGSAQFAGVRRRLHRADLTVGNLEGTYSEGGSSKCGDGTTTAEEGEDTGPTTCFAFQAPPKNAVALRKAGFGAVNLANNHAWDYGPEGQRQTTEALRRAHVAATGRPGEITILERRGMRIALLGFAGYPWAGPIKDLAAVRTQVADARRRADYVVVAMHAGGEGADQTHVPQGTEEAFGEDRGDSRAFAHTAIDAGADLVVGSGPHVIRGVERYRRGLIAYSLGNFAGWDNFGLGGPLSESGILRVKLGPAGVVSGKWIPVTLTGPGIPEVGGTSEETAAQLSKEDFGAAAGLKANGRIVRQRTGATT